jgi:hypothetical protein
MAGGWVGKFELKNYKFASKLDCILVLKSTEELNLGLGKQNQQTR